MIRQQARCLRRGAPAPLFTTTLKVKDEISRAHQNFRGHLPRWLPGPGPLQAALIDSLLFRLLPGRILPGLAVEAVAAVSRGNPENNEKDRTPDEEKAATVLGDIGPDLL